MLTAAKLDKQLRARVRLFGDLLGNVLRSQEDIMVLKTVQSLRRGFTVLREKDNPAKRLRLGRQIRRLNPALLSNVIRAFSVFFSLANIAEEAHQHRARRERVRLGVSLWEGSFDTTFKELKKRGITAQQLEQLLNKLAFVPVFTAHPTEAKRRTIMNALRRIFVQGERLHNPRLGKEGVSNIKHYIETLIQILWKTNEVRAHRPQVRDEIRTGLHYFHESLFAAVPLLYRYMEKSLRRVYGKDSEVISIPSFLRFGSWIGGDRDGNPFVKPETTDMAVRLHAQEILSEYINRIQHLSELLTQSSLMCTPSQAFTDQLKTEEDICIRVFPGKSNHFNNEPYRRKLRIIHYRLEATLHSILKPIKHSNGPTQDGYSNQEVFLNDLYLIRDSLISHSDKNVADGELKDLIRLTETFGFNLVNLDLRQESTRHSDAVNNITQQLDPDSDYLSMHESQRMQLLEELINDLPSLDINTSKLNELSRETLDVFKVMSLLREEVSPDAFGEYVISMTHAPSHVMEVIFLAGLNGLVGKTKGDWFCNIRVSPLFETIDDLEHIETVLGNLLDNPTYGALIRASGNLQEVMLGYSDSCKDGGILASSWSLYEAQKKIIEVTKARNIRCLLFHGRGGTMARGGGPTHETLLAYPPGTVEGYTKFTEQGEVLFYKYNNPETATYELSVGMSGLIKASTHLIDNEISDYKHFANVMDDLAKTGEKSYRGLIDETPGLLDYFYEVTPVTEIGMMNIGSRPTHRSSGDRTISSIRAIPWVFGWAQARHTLPAWYGVGTALEKWRNSDPMRLAKLQRMYQEWPFFHSLLSNTQMALFKAEMDIAREYTKLSKNPDTAAKIYQMIRDEYQRTKTQILNIAGLNGLLEETPALALSLSRRNPYLDPLNQIQVILLSQYRDESLPEEEREQWLDPLLRSINAIAAGMRNTG